MVNKLLVMLCPNWTICLLGLTTDGACNMTRLVTRNVTCLINMMHKDLFIYWDLARIASIGSCYGRDNEQCHQETIVFTNDWIYYSLDTAAKNLIVDRGIANYMTFFLIVGFWQKKVIIWSKIYQTELLDHIKSKQPTSAPPRLWWAAFLSMHHFTIQIVIVFCAIQMLITLVLQQKMR